MRRIKPRSILLSTVFGTLIGMALLGSTTGTLAWYIYVTKATLAYKGTSVRRSEQLEIGLIDNAGWFTEQKLQEFHLTRADMDGKSIVFTPAGTRLEPEVIQFYLEHTSYATNRISPVTSRKFEINGDLTLYKALTSHYEINTDPAAYDSYVKIPFAFRALNSNNEAIPHENIWVTAMETASSVGYDTHKGIRTYFENVNKSTHFLVNPSSLEESADPRQNRVAGVLDLDGDGYFDYDDDHKEIVYGDYDKTKIVYSSSEYVTPPSGAPLDDVNDTKTSVASTFVAKHAEGVYTVDKSSLANATYYAKYDTLATVRPDDDGTGRFSNGKPVAYTNDNGVGYTNLTVYLEGWDHAVVDRIINTEFDLGIQFEIDRS